MSRFGKFAEILELSTLPFRAAWTELRRFFSTNPPPMAPAAAIGRALAFLLVSFGSVIATEKYDLHPGTFFVTFWGMLFLILLQNYIRGIRLDMKPPPGDDIY